MTDLHQRELRSQKVGVDFLWTDEGNSGRVNYIYSLVSALATLPPGEQPELVIFHLPNSPVHRLKETGYSRLRFQVLIEGCIPRFTTSRKMVNKISRLAIGRNAYDLLEPIPADMVDCVIPCEHRDVFRNVPRRIHWIVDFNCFRLPELFSEDALKKHREHIEQIVGLGEELMFSSMDALQDFRTFFRDATNPTHVIRFAVGLPSVPPLTKDELTSKYGIRDSYFMTPNTFWAHKNHQVLVRAMRRCMEQGCDFDLVLTGKQTTYHGDVYFREIESLVSKLGLTARIHFLGLVERSEQVALLANATGIVQPSKFEGWSTVVEEAKALGRPLIVSDIAIHREQVSDGIFFPPDDDEVLNKRLIEVSDRRGDRYPAQNSYQENIQAFSSSLIDLINGQVSTGVRQTR